MSNKLKISNSEYSSLEMPDIHSSSFVYAKRFSGEVGQWFLSVQYQATKFLIQNQKFRTVLDVGGGHGQNIPFFIKNGADVTITGSNSSCAITIQELIENEIIKFKVASLTDLPFSNKSFDIVLSYRILPHLKKWRDLVSEMCRVSKCSVIVEFPVQKSFNSASKFFFKAKKILEGNTRPYKLFRESEMQYVFNKNGFVKKNKYSLYFFPMAFHRLHGSFLLGRFMEDVSRRVGLTSIFGSPVIIRFDRM